MSFKDRIEKPLKHLFDGNKLNVYEENVINLGVGTPSLYLLKGCCEIFKAGTDHKMEYEADNSSYLFQYGPSVGSFQYRTKLAEFLTKRYQSIVHAEDLVLTAGATNGLHLILSTLVDMNGYVFLDEVTYMIALEAISQFSSMKIVPVKLLEDGVDVLDLEEKIKKHQFSANGKMFWGIYYTIPIFHNPTSCIFSEETNKALIEISRKYEVLVVCDDVYNLLTFESEKPPKRLYGYDCFDDEGFRGNVISNGTFSKIMAPGIRVGWMECPPRITRAFKESGILKSGGAINNYTSGIMSSVIELGLAEKQLNECLKLYKSQCDTLCQALDGLPPNVKFHKPKGGYFVWIELPVDCDSGDLSEHILTHYKVFVIQGNRFSVENKFKNFIRLSFAFNSLINLREGGLRLCEGIRDFLAKTR